MTPAGSNSLPVRAENTLVSTGQSQMERFGTLTGLSEAQAEFKFSVMQPDTICKFDKTSGADVLSSALSGLTSLKLG